MTEIIPPNEPERLAAVRRYDILDTPPDGAFDRITRLAARLFEVPISIVSIVDADRIWFKSHHGLDVAQIDRDPGLCASAVLQDAPWIVPDAKRDVRALANPLVAGEFGLRFYSGVPLRTADGFNLGTLCVIDKRPRTVTPEQIAHLEDLAAIVMDELELRLAARRAVAQQQVLVREVHHRVKNNLQIITSLINLRTANVPREVKTHVDDLLHRIGAMGQLHEHFYRGDEVTSVGLREYLHDLAWTLITGHALEDQVTCRVSGDDAEVDLDLGTPLTLLVTEIISNACKHAFPDGRRGAIDIAIQQTGQDLTLRIHDNGVGLPPGKPDQRSMGLRLVERLVRQIDGAFRLSADHGTTFTLTFPLAADHRGASCQGGTRAVG